MATHSSVLAWRIPGTGDPGGLPSMGSHRVGHDWSNLAAAAIKLTSFGTTKETIEKEKATYPTGENICKVYDQSGLNSRIYKELYHPKTKAKMIQSKNRQKT